MRNTLQALLLTGLTVLTPDVQAFLGRSSTPCNLRTGGDCKNLAVFLRDAKDECIGDAETPSNCLMTFCKTNCALPAHQIISETAKPLCEKHCEQIDFMNRKLQQNMNRHFPTSLTEEAAQQRSDLDNNSDHRNKKAEANFNAAFGGTIAQLQKAGWDRVNAAEKLKYYRHNSLEAEKDFKEADELLKATEQSLQENGFSEPEIKALLADYFAAEQQLKNTNPKDIQIGFHKAAKQLYEQVTSMARKKSSPSSEFPTNTYEAQENTLEELLGDDTTVDSNTNPFTPTPRFEREQPPQTVPSLFNRFSREPDRQHIKSPDGEDPMPPPVASDAAEDLRAILRKQGKDENTIARIIKVKFAEHASVSAVSSAPTLPSTDEEDDDTPPARSNPLLDAIKARAGKPVARETTRETVPSSTDLAPSRNTMLAAIEKGVQLKKTTLNAAQKPAQNTMLAAIKGVTLKKTTVNAPKKPAPRNAPDGSLQSILETSLKEIRGKMHQDQQGDNEADDDDDDDDDWAK